jgi:hypothetical protein
LPVNCIIFNYLKVFFLCHNVISVLTGLITEPFPFAGGANRMELGEGTEGASGPTQAAPPPSYDEVLHEEDGDPIGTAAAGLSSTPEEGETNKVKKFIAVIIHVLGQKSWGGG